jgi:hypothetical protein
MRHRRPPSTVFAMPRSVPAYTISGRVGSIASAVTRVHGRVATSLQLPPAFVLLKTLQQPPAWTISELPGSIASAETQPPSGPCDGPQLP